MNVALTPEMEALIEDRFEALRRDLQKGIDDLDNGRYRDVRSSAAEMAEEFHARGLQRLQSAAT